jgi:general stress protein 26
MSHSPPTDQPIHARVWQELQCATQDREHEWRTPVLATAGADGSVQARTVVLRRADGEAQALTFHTDSRSPKVAQLRAAPLASLVFWSRRLSWQLRVQAAFSVQVSGPQVDAAWRAVSTSATAAADYLGAGAPGARLFDGSAAPTDRHHLAILTARVQSMDWLELSAEGHRRGRLSASGVDWLVP